MSPEIPGRPDRFKGIDDKSRSSKDGSSGHPPNVTFDPKKQEESDLDKKINALKRYQRDDPKVKEALAKFEAEKAAQNQDSQSSPKPASSETSSNNQENGNNLENLPENKQQLQGDYGQRIRESNKPGDFTPELKDAQSRQSSEQKPSETPPQDQSEKNQDSSQA